MNDTLSKIFIFATGAAIASVITWKVLDAKYSKRAEQEIKDVKEYYESKYKLTPVSAGTNNEPNTTTVINVTAGEFESMKKAYSDLTSIYKSKEGGSEPMDTAGMEPRVIPPDEFDSLDDYDTVSLTHYTDGVLTDEDDNIIEDVANTVGEDYASHFGEFEDDSVFVRNDRLKTDYEILMDYRPYKDVVDVDSNLNGDE